MSRLGSHAGPIILGGQVTVVPGQGRMVDPVRLQNPYRQPMLIDEIRYRHLSSDPEDNTPFMSGVAHWAIRARHLLGRAPLTSEFVPIGSLAKNLGTVPAVFGDPAFLTPAGSAAISAWFTWKLPKPLYVPGTEYLSTEIFNAFAPGTPLDIPTPLVSFTVQVEYAGRTLEKDTPPPPMVNIPWAAFFETTFLQTATDSTETSTEANLRNPFNEPLKVQRFIGRPVINNFDNESGAEFAVDSPTAIARFTTVRAADSFGRILVRDPVSFPQLFYFPDRSWTVNTKLQPKGFYLFEVARDFRTLLPTINVNFPFFSNAMLISMIGHREVAFQP